MKHISMTQTRYSYKPGFESDDIRVTGARRPQSTTLVYHPENIEEHGFAAREARLDQWVLFALQHPTVIDNHGGSAAERARMRVELAIEEPFTIEGVEGTWMLVERDQFHLEGDGVKPVPARPGNVPEDAKLVRVPHSEVAMHMRVAGTMMWAAPVGEHAAQLYELNGKRFSAPVLRSEAGLR